MDKKERLKKVFDLGKEGELSSAEKDNLLKNILQDVQKQRYIRRIRWSATAAAALLILSFIFYYSDNQNIGQPVDLVSIAKTNETKFSDHEHIQIIESDQHTRQFAVKSIHADEGAQHHLFDTLALHPSDTGRREIYATLYVPYGKRQEFQLPDGSTVWLNAGSYLTFASYIPGKAREVYLNGEGYFDVKHTGTAFIVKTKHANIHVLGTTFNLSAYEDDQHTTVDLLSGKVIFASTKNLFSEITMAPGERIDYNNGRSQINIDRKSAGTDILWTKKQLAFDNVPFSVLIRKLERVYNVRIIADETLRRPSVAYSGRLNIDVDVISSLKNIYELSDYNLTLDKKEVKISRKK